MQFGEFIRQAVVFPGQGSQRKGMAVDFAEQFSEAREIFRIASDLLSLDILALCREGSAELDLTEFSQPCILTAECAMFSAIQQRFHFAPQYFAGHSLGEYSALVCSGAIPFEAAIRLVRLRGQLMQKAVPIGEGGMIAIIRESQEINTQVIQKLAQRENVDIANDNSPFQIVISGALADLERFSKAVITLLKDPTVRLVGLPVSAPFHSRHMSSISEEFKLALQKTLTRVGASVTQVVSNTSGTFHSAKLEDLIQSLTRQISAPVLWQDNMKTLIKASDSIFEIGPGRPLGGFFKSVGLPIASVMDVRSAKRTFVSTVKEYTV